MALQPGSRVGSYEVIDTLGAGGMGEVYRARDSKLGREVALKVLPDQFVSDADRLARFLREAQLLASLNHPNIAHIHGLEESAASRALVMELVEGVTLAERIANGPLPLEEASPIARQIAEALEAAHERGIVHRDLKPANVKVRDDGSVKVLDFGLAKALDPAAVSPAISQSPTLSVHATQAGIILGTAAYMSPEQARGKSVDSRTDIWAFGVVLFEMLAGRRPFDGDEVSDTLASVLKTEPHWELLPGNLPAPMLRLLRRCLEKDRRQRLQHIGDARLELAETERPEPVAQNRTGLRGRERAVWVLLLAVAVAFAAFAGSRYAARPESPEMRVEVSTPDAPITFFALAPDGQSIAYSARSERGQQIWVRNLASTSARPIRGTEGGEFPFWSPDGAHLWFFANYRLKRISVDGGTATTIGRALTPAGGSWGPDGTILFVPADNGPVFATSETGAEPRRVTPARPIATRLPQFLPDGRRFLFFASSGIEPPGVYVGQLGSDEISHVLGTDWPALYVPGHLVFVRDSTLFAQQFDSNSLELSGPPQKLADDVTGGLFAASIAVSASGTIGYRTGPGGRAPRHVTWFDRSGKRLQEVGDEGGFVSNPSLSPDGRQLAVQRTTGGNVDIWIIDLERNLSNRLTSHPAVESLPLWSPDGAQLAIGQSVTDGGPAVLRLDRPSELTSLGITGVPGTKILTDWSRDGRFMMFKVANQENGANDLWAMTLDGERKSFPIANAGFDERDGQFAPDGHWVAFESDESGVPEIYVQRFPDPGQRRRVSTNGGTQVRWRADGLELYYIGPDEGLMAVPIVRRGDDISIGTPARLFTLSLAPVRAISRQQYVASDDGQRFLAVESRGAPVPPVTLLLNWRGAVASR